MGAAPSQEYKFGWRRDPHDLTLYRRHLTVGDTPTAVDLRSKCPPVYNQGSLSSCTAMAVGGAYQYSCPSWSPSTLFIYYQERALEGTISEDCGAILRDGYVVLAETGVCSNNTWPYVYSKFSTQPPVAAYTEAITHKIKGFYNIEQTLEQLKTCLCNNIPLTFGFVVYQSFMSIGANGIMPLPQPREQQIGGHAVLLVGYDDVKQVAIVRNSWGSSWGAAGYFYMPYSYLLNNDYAGDFWAIV